MNEAKQELLKQLYNMRDNALFESKEDEDTIEHVDLPASEVKSLLTKAIVWIDVRD